MHGVALEAIHVVMHFQQLVGSLSWKALLVSNPNIRSTMHQITLLFNYTIAQMMMFLYSGKTRKMHAICFVCLFVYLTALHNIIQPKTWLPCTVLTE